MMTTEMIDKLYLELAQFTQAMPAREAELLNCIRAIGRVVGCGHTEDVDGRVKLVACVEERCRRLDMNTDFGWVIEHERSSGSSPEYWTGLNTRAIEWTDPGDHLQACRFSRKADAEKVSRGLSPFGHKHRICEHGWSKIAPDVSPQTAATMRLKDNLAL